MPLLLLVFVIVKHIFTTFDTGSVTEGARRATEVTLPTHFIFPDQGLSFALLIPLLCNNPA